MSKLIQFKGKTMRINPNNRKTLQSYSGMSWGICSWADFEFEDILDHGDYIMAIDTKGHTYKSMSLPTKSGCNSITLHHQTIHPAIINAAMGYNFYFDKWLCQKKSISFLTQP
ncbi:MAG: hypothetical protein J5629_03190 [Muribaculaceae bacterium]|nr:hypothetical protein [Muribaculaceae bacterium]